MSATFSLDRISRSQIFWIWLAGGAVLLSFAMKASFLPVRELWLDETHSALLARMPLASLINFVVGDVHPPLYFLLLSQWVSAAGDSPEGLRLFSLLTSLLLAATFTILAVQALGWRTGLFGLVLLSFSPALFWYSVEVRMYVMATLCITLAAVFLRRINEGVPCKRDVLLFGVFSALAFYTHYFNLFIIAGMFAHWLFCFGRHSSQRNALLLASSMILMLTAPWMPTVHKQYVEKQTQMRAVQAAMQDPDSLNYGSLSRQPSMVEKCAAISHDFASLLGVYPARNRAGLVLFAMPFALAMLGWIWLAWRGDYVSRLGLILTAAVIIGMLLVGVIARRYLLMLAPFLVLVLARVVQELMAGGNRWRRWFGLALGAALLISSVGGTIRIWRQSYPQPTVELVNFLSNHVLAGDLIIFDALYGEVPYEYYSHQIGFSAPTRGFPVGIHSWWENQSFKGWGGPIIKQATLRHFVDNLMQEQGGGRVWLVLFETNYYDPRDQLLHAFEGRARKIASWRTGPTPFPDDKSQYRVFEIVL